MYRIIHIYNTAARIFAFNEDVLPDVKYFCFAGKSQEVTNVIFQEPVGG